MNAKQKRILKYVGYAVFYLFTLMFFAFVTFPFARLRTRIQNEFNASQTGPSPLTLRLGHLSSYWFSGIRADDVDLISAPSTAPPEDPGKPAKPKVMRIDTVHARVRMASHARACVCCTRARARRVRRNARSGRGIDPA